jgi:magnesium-protoporphyrin IX monomethyl ester (oxidative) cyclase
MTTAEHIESPTDAIEKARASSLLSPRFYTTDFAAMDRIDVSSLRSEWDTMMAEYEGDNNHDHFQRTPEFAAEVAQLTPTWSPELRQEFLRLPDQLDHVRVFGVRAVRRDPGSGSATPTSRN